MYQRNNGGMNGAMRRIPEGQGLSLKTSEGVRYVEIKTAEDFQRTGQIHTLAGAVYLLDEKIN